MLGQQKLVMQSCTVFCTVPWSNWEEKASFANQDQVCSPHMCTPEGCPCWGWGAAGATWLPHGPYPIERVTFSFLLAPPSSCVLGDQFSVLLPTILLMCFLVKGGHFCRGNPSSLKGGLDASVHFHVTQTSAIFPSGPDSFPPSRHILPMKDFTRT